jgi:TolB-like protein/Tfp pilus assembly protein PilF
MKRCPECRKDYVDDSLLYCLDDGMPLVQGVVDEPQTAILHQTAPPREAATQAQIHVTGQTEVLPARSVELPRSNAFDKRLVLAPVALAVMVLGGFFGYRYFAAPKQIESIAVMPFVNESGNADVEYLSDGMTETLIGSLTQLPNLNVKARSSVFRYKGKETDAKTVGKELGVQAVLNGRFGQRGDQLTLSLELVDAATENAIWSQQYTRKQSDIVSLQTEVARDVSSKLKSKLSGAEVAKVEKAYTASPEAYQLYLKGRFQWNRRTGDSLKQAVEFFNQAIERDPKYALAYSGLAESYTLFSNYSVATPSESMPRAKAAAMRAVELDDSLAETRVALGIYYANYAWNQPAAEKEFRRAIELNPNYATAHQQFAIECLTAMGRFDEAIAEGKRAEELDPASPIIGADFGNVLLRARRYDESIAQLNRVIALDPNFWVANWYIGMAYHGKGDYPGAVAAYRKGLAMNDNPWIKALLVLSLAKLGERGEAAKLLGELEAESAKRYVSSSSLAIAHSALGDKDKAFFYLNKDVNERGSRPQVFSVNPIWDELRDDPRFAEVLRRVESEKLE